MMLHKSKSKKRNLLKYVLVLPFLSLFLMGFNVEEVYIAKETPHGTSQINGDTDSFYIHNTFSEKDFYAFIDKLKNKGYSFNLRDIERRSDNLITKINFTIEKDGIEGKYRIASGLALDTIVIVYSKAKKRFIINTSSFIEKSSLENQGTVEIRFHKNMTSTELKTYKKDLKAKYNLDFTYNVIERNTKNEITKFEYKLDNGTNATGMTIGPLGPIQPFIIKYNPATKLMITYSLDENGEQEYGRAEYLDKLYTYPITKSYKDSYLNSLIKQLKKKNVTLTINKVERNIKGEIIAININAKSKGGNSINFDHDSGKPIGLIAISFYGDGNGLKIGPPDIENLTEKNEA